MARKPIPIEELNQKLFKGLPHLQVIAGEDFSISKRALGLQVYLSTKSIILDCQSLYGIISKGSWIIVPNWVMIEDPKKNFKILRTGEDEKYLVLLKDPMAKGREIAPLEIGKIEGRNGRPQESIGIGVVPKDILYRIINSEWTEDLTPSVVASDINRGLRFWQCTQ